MIYTYVANAVCPQNFALEPAEIIDSDAIFLPGYRDEDVLSFQDLHLLETSPGYKLIDFSLTAPVQQH